MECDEKSRPEGSSYSRSTSIGNFIRRYLRSTAIVSTSAPSTSYFLSFFLSPSSSPFLSPSRNSLRRYASQERRAAVEQRTDINNPEFPTDVLIIRFQGPPILAGSRARKRIFLSSSRRTRSLPLPFSSSPSHDPLLSRTVSFLPSPLPVSSSISSARFLSRGTPSASKFASRSKQRGTLPPLEMRVAYLWPKTVVRAYKESERGEGRPQMGHEKCGERAYVYDKRPLLYRPRNWKRTREKKGRGFGKSFSRTILALIFLYFFLARKIRIEVIDESLKLQETSSNFWRAEMRRWIWIRFNFGYLFIPQRRQARIGGP